MKLEIYQVIQRLGNGRNIEYTVKANYRHLEGDTSEAIPTGLI